MLKILSINSAKPKKGGVGIGGNNRARCDRRCKLDRKETGNNKIDDKVDDEVEKKSQKTSKSKNLFKKLSKSKKIVESDFFTLGARLAFIKLRQAFVKAQILYYFDPECYIWVETDASSYAIDRILSQLTLDDLSQ